VASAARWKLICSLAQFLRVLRRAAGACQREGALESRHIPFHACVSSCAAFSTAPDLPLKQDMPVPHGTDHGAAWGSSQKSRLSRGGGSSKMCGMLGILALQSSWVGVGRADPQPAAGKGDVGLRKLPRYKE